MKGPYIVTNSKGQICQFGYSLYNTNEEGRQALLKEAELIDKYLKLCVKKYEQTQE